MIKGFAVSPLDRAFVLLCMGFIAITSNYLEDIFYLLSHILEKWESKKPNI